MLEILGLGDAFNVHASNSAQGELYFDFFFPCQSCLDSVVFWNLKIVLLSCLLAF